MSGQWVLDDSQSLYYLDSEDGPGKVSAEPKEPLLEPENAPFRHPDSSSPAAHGQGMPIRHQNKSPGRGTPVTASAITSPAFKRPRLSSESNYLGRPCSFSPARDSSAVDQDSDIDIMSDDAFSVATPSTATKTKTTRRATATSVFAPTYPPILEISRNDRSCSLASSNTNKNNHNHRAGRTPVRAHREESDKSQKEAQQAITRTLARLNRATLSDHTFTHPLSGLDLVMGFNTSLPKSRFDTYITALRQLLQCAAERCSLSNDLQRAITAEGVLWVVREAWPAAEGYWNLTATFQGFLHSELWRNFPCQRSYNQLPPAYRPTRIQLSIPHSPMIDWMPWPDVRDMAIMHQDQIDVDALFRMAIHNVVAHRKRLGRRKQSFSSSSISKEHDNGCEPGSSKQKQVTATTADGEDNVTDRTSFRVWDLVCLEKANGTPPLAEPGLEKKPVLRSPGLRALQRAYDLEYDEFDTQKLDDCFFEAYPCLYADTAASAWKVRSFPNLPHEDVGGPIALTRPAVFRLKSRIESMIGAAIEI
ncbi:uncharacterized protein Z519_03475 [Cladophialophora bantiana CBS 173.52]|uniref:Uncharacterized protein n=1 Tax=Cladophialophora bantiana (strain ATCC 10958 / CBS 173.52 / CDC B-1940 / NIH 8579) TaxID=1442370 RepID=A0A0D2F2I1_CLAB1|nr:uncharacterized protein Z519_03475 [Cladophialophora bantiana CBS 173.52]KIW96406.1 hypothetical protein Z519_03475 [Cladophialophora bantiana CBS 173.52]